MTRPTIVRADTIDLQDQLSPSAKDHSRRPTHAASGGLAAPHQASELRHVQHERHAEEAALSSAWNNAHGLSDEPPSEDDDMYTQDGTMDGDTLLASGDLLGPSEESDTGDEEDVLGDDMERASSSPSITDEDIDFDLVYALHNFVATVEGQANAAKGDTMVLLDDSNSYWWLVRVVKDSTIGYLPAEHIETPTERLARLNKHRNIDATKMHFEDSLEKPKNPLRRAIRRRNQKQVSFADPTYRDAPQYDYSSEEDEEEGDEMDGRVDINGQAAQVQESLVDDEDDEITTVAPLNIRSVKDPQQSQELAVQSAAEDRRSTLDEPRPSDDTERVGPGRSRMGTVRNTDSFFKDDTVETKKITITPRLLREDNNTSTDIRTSDVRERGSFDFDKTDRKEDKNNKKKKGMFNIFKRNKPDKKVKEDSTGSSKTSSEYSRDSPVPTSGTSSPAEKLSLDNPGLQRKGSKGKLQKSQPNGLVKNAISPATKTIPEEEPIQIAAANGQLAPQDKGLVNGDLSRGDVTKQIKVVEQDSFAPKSQNPFADPKANKQTRQEPDALSESPVHVTAEDAHPDVEPPALVRDTSSDSDDVHSLRDSPSPPVQNGLIPEPRQRIEGSSTLGVNQHLPSSPISPISPLSAFTVAAAASAAGLGGMALAARSNGPPAPTRSPPPQPHDHVLPLGPLSSPVYASDRQNSTSTTTSAILSSAPSTPVWSDASLRHYLDESGANDIRDLLLLTRDTTGVVPVSQDHPLMSGLYTEERGKVREMDEMLNGLLGTWLDKKMRSKSSMSVKRAL